MATKKQNHNAGSKTAKPVKKAVKAPVKKAAPKKAASKPLKKAAKAPVAKSKPNSKQAPKKAEKLVKKPVVPAKKAAPVKKAPVAKKPEPKKTVPVVHPPVKPAVKPTEARKAAKVPEVKKPVEAKHVEVKPAEIKQPVAIKPPTPKPVPAKPVAMPKINATTSRKYEPDFTKSVLDQPSTIMNGPTLRYSDSELQEFRDLIARKLDAAKKELSYLHGLITRKDEMSGDETDNRYMTMEDGSLSMEREQLSQMASRQHDFIDKLEKALVRIENKTYGICRVTGKLIDKARLRAVPHATLSIEAKMGMSRNPNIQ
jgi:RNA polymerase-binding transcription factor DksA